MQLKIACGDGRNLQSSHVAVIQSNGTICIIIEHFFISGKVNKQDARIKQYHTRVIFKCKIIKLKKNGGWFNHYWHFWEVGFDCFPNSMSLVWMLPHWEFLPIYLTTQCKSYSSFTVEKHMFLFFPRFGLLEFPHSSGLTKSSFDEDAWVLAPTFTSLCLQMGAPLPDTGSLLKSCASA